MPEVEPLKNMRRATAGAEAPEVIPSEDLMLQRFENLTLILATTLLAFVACTGDTTGPIRVASVRIAQHSATIETWDTLVLMANALDGRGNPIPGAAISWSSGSPSATRMHGDTLIALAESGPFPVTASVGEHADTIIVTITRRHVATATITTRFASVIVGQVLQLEVSLRDKRGHSLSDSVLWSTTDTTLARVSANGRLEGIAVGEPLTVRASSGGAADEITLSVIPEPVQSLAMAADSISLGKGRSTTLSVTVRGTLGHVLSGRTTAWSSSAPEIATVVNGLVTATAEGVATITATVEGISASVRIKVLGAPVASITISPTAVSIIETQRTTLVATLRDSAGNVLRGRRVFWSTSDPNLATVEETYPEDVDSTAVVAVGFTGEARITAWSEDVSSSALVRITAIAEPASIAIAPSVATVPRGIPLNLLARVYDRAGRVLGGRPITFTSDRPDLVSISDARSGDASSASVIGLHSGGPATITASFGGVSTTAAISIEPARQLGDLAAGANHSCGIDTDQMLWCWGFNEFLQLGSYASYEYEPRSPFPVVANTAVKFLSVSGGWAHTCGIATDHQLYCWGVNSSGQLGLGGMSDPIVSPRVVLSGRLFTSVAAGGNQTCALQTTGEAYCWGGVDYPDGYGSIVAAPTRVLSTETVIAITVGANHNCALVVGGGAMCWGYAVLGDSTLTPSLTPVTVRGKLAFSSIAAGHGYTCGLTPAGSAYCWGDNNVGQLGNGGTDVGLTPQPVSGGRRFVQLTAGGFHACALTADGAAYCWGSNEYGELGSGYGGFSTIPIAVGGGLRFQKLAAGANHTCGLTVDGFGYCWGSDFAIGSIGPTTNTPRGIAIFAP